jgi:SAM-dependent methyltransferase
MFRVYKFPPGYLPFWNLGVRLSLMQYGRFLKRLKNLGKTKLLDVGAGAGWNSIIAADSGFSVIALDHCHSSVAAINKLADKLKLQGFVSALKGDCRRLQFSDESFDVAVSAHVIEHLDEPVLMLEEIARVLKPGGSLLLSCPSLHHWMEVARWTGLNTDPLDHKVIGYEENVIKKLLPPSLAIKNVTYQGRVIESNIISLQGILSTITGIKAIPEPGPNPGDGRVSSSLRYDAFYVWLLSILKELFLLPLMFLCTAENLIFAAIKGSMITIEITKENKK